MRIKKIFAAVLACLAIGPSMAWGQCTTWTTSTIRNCNGLDYELWNQNNKGTVSMTITGGSTNPNGGTFEATWNGTENILTRAGKKWGASSTTTARSVGNISLDFAATWSSADNVKMLGIYGWAYYPSGSNPTKTESGQNTSFSNQIEYYIIQDRGSYNPASGGTNAKKYGEGTIDGIVYEFWVADRINQPMLTGNGNFKQYFSVPKSTSSHRQSGVVSISKHFDGWDKAGMKMMDCPLYEVAMKVESYTGSANGKGSAKVTKNLLTLGGTVNPNEFSLVTSVSPAGSGTVTKSPNTTSYAPNASVQLTATPAAGYKFVGWSGAITGTTSPATVTMSADRTVTAKFELVSGDGTTNLIKDGNFPSSTVIAEDGASWKLGQGTNWGNSVATSSVANGTATINVTTLGTETYQPQLVQYGVALDKDMKYKLTFKARAASARKIEAAFQQSVDPWAGYASFEFDLTTTEQTFEYVFTMTSDTDLEAQFAFNLGQATGSVYLSDVKVVQTTSTPTSISRDLFAVPGSRSMVSLTGKTLNVMPVDGATLRVRVVDVNGKVRANFNAASTSAFSLAHVPAGKYFLDVTGAGVKQSTPIVLD